MTSSNEPLEGSTSLNGGITPNTDQGLKESLIRSKLQELIQGDQACNAQYDDTIITWKNIVDRTKSIVEKFGKSHASTTTTTTTFEPTKFNGFPLSHHRLLLEQDSRLRLQAILISCSKVLTLPRLPT